MQRQMGQRQRRRSGVSNAVAEAVRTASSEWGRSSDRAGCEDAEQVALFPLQPFVRRARLLHRSVVLDDPIVERLHDVRQ